MKIEESKKAKLEEAKKAAEEKVKDDFWDKVQKSKDLHDNLDDLTNFIQKHTGATGVYIGKLVYPMKEIEEDAGELDHEDQEAPKVIRYIHATENHKFLIDRCLGPDEGITHDVFKDATNVEEEQQEENPEEEGEEKPVEEKDIIDTFKHVYVEEVVRQPRMLYQKVPRLGAYMAVPMVYNSCLFDDSLEQAVADFVDVAQRQEA